MGNGRRAFLHVPFGVRDARRHALMAHGYLHAARGILLVVALRLIQRLGLLPRPDLVRHVDGEVPVFAWEVDAREKRCRDRMRRRPLAVTRQLREQFGLHHGHTRLGMVVLRGRCHTVMPVDERALCQHHVRTGLQDKLPHHLDGVRLPLHHERLVRELEDSHVRHSEQRPDLL